MGSFGLTCYNECEGIGGFCEDAGDTSIVLGKRGGLAIHTPLLRRTNERLHTVEIPGGGYEGINAQCGEEMREGVFRADRCLS